MTGQPDPREKSMRMGNGTMHYVKFGAVTCKRYTGTFTVPALIGKAETGLWYTLIEGNPFGEQGEGTTPELAIADAISRTKERIARMEHAVAALEAARAS